MRFLLIVAGVVVMGLAGCAPDPKDYETAPVLVQTEKGTVKCQLYRYDTVLWDEAIDFPRTMSLAEADQVCQDEGFRVKREGR